MQEHPQQFAELTLSAHDGKAAGSIFYCKEMYMCNYMFANCKKTIQIVILFNHSLALNT
jgi:hypothetical protein